MNPLPQRFYSCHVCGGGSPSLPFNQAAACGAAITNDAYYSLSFAQRLYLLGIGIGSNSQVRLATKRGFVFDWGDNSGQGITDSPQVTLSPINGGAAGAWTATNTFPALVCASGADPFTWKFAYAPTTGQFRLETDSGAFKWVDATTIPGIVNVASQGTTVRDVRPFGFWAPDETLGSPVWEPRRMTIFDKGVIVGIIDGNSNPQQRCLDPSTDTFAYPGTAQVLKLQYQTLEQVDNTNAPITGGFDVLDPSTVADGVPLFYSPSQKKLYRSPVHTREFITNDANVAVTLNTGYQSYSGHLIFGTHANKFKNISITALATFSTQEQFIAGLFRNGTLIHTWNFDVNAQPNNSFTFVYLDTAAPIGNLQYEIRFKVSSGTNATTIFYSAGSLFTLPD